MKPRGQKWCPKVSLYDLSISEGDKEDGVGYTIICSYHIQIPFFKPSVKLCEQSFH